MIAYLINELGVRGGTHKQLLKLVEYTEQQGREFCIITKTAEWDKAYAGFMKYKDKTYIVGEEPSDSKWRKIVYLFYTICKLRKLLKNVDVINIHDCGYEMLFPAFIGKKVIWQVNDLPPCFHVGNAKDTSETFWSRLRVKYILLFKDIVTKFTVNVSKNKERIKQFFHRDADVLYCGIEPVRIDRKIEDTFRRFDNKEVHILSSGVFFPYRNYETQVLVMRELVKMGINAHLNIIGSCSFNPEYVTKIKNMITDNHLDECITICGQVDETEFKKLHQDADVFIFINIDQSWGLAVFEAMSCGLPVIVSKSVGATEILHDKQDAIFVEPTDVKSIAETIIQLMQDKTYYQNISDVAKGFYQDYTWEKAYCVPMLELLLKYDK